MSGYQTLSEIRSVWEPDSFRKRRKPDVRFSDVYCTYLLLRQLVSLIMSLACPIPKRRRREKDSCPPSICQTFTNWTLTPKSLRDCQRIFRYSKFEIPKNPDFRCPKTVWRISNSYLKSGHRSPNFAAGLDHFIYF